MTLFTDNSTPAKACSSHLIEIKSLYYENTFSFYSYDWNQVMNDSDSISYKILDVKNPFCVGKEDGLK